MIHIATCHWQTDKWIDVQLALLDKHVESPFRVYADLHGVDARHEQRLFRSYSLEGDHAEKLNELARHISTDADADDLLVFIDGDAFPIAPFDARVHELLSRWPLAAVRRDENMQDRQPHPCFCVTTVGFWNEIEGDWRKGHLWRTPEGIEWTDVGGNLLGILERRGIEWKPLLRTNERNLHPLMFGIYGDLVYHHGAGFRFPSMRVDYEHFVKAALHEGRPWRESKEERIRIAAENQRLSDYVYERIVNSDDFCRELFSETGEGAPSTAR